MRKYDSYKDSGIEWIGEIPEHWEVKKIKQFTNVLTGSTPKSTEETYWNGDINWVTTDDLGKLKTKDIIESRRQITEKGFNSSGTYLAPVDSIVLSTRAPIGHIGILKIEACTNQGCKTIIANKKFDSVFLYYYLHSGKSFLNSLGVGTTFVELPTQSLKDFSVPFPTPSEQTAIANYLDRKTAEIDELIADKKRLLELYEEEKTAIINQAVTKGINPDAPMKDSGIEWLGEIPEHWEVKRIRHVAQIFGRIGYRGYKTTDLVQKGEGAITISPSNMKGYYMDFSDCSYLSWEKYEESPEIMIQNGDILFVKTGSTYGKSSIVENLPEKATINPQIIVLKEIQCNNKLFWYIIKSEYTQFQVEGTVVGGTIPTISQAKINNYEFVITPDEKEQQAIVEFIDNACSLIDAKKAKTEKLIELLTEYRTALISEVVTGKIKVID